MAAGSGLGTRLVFVGLTMPSSHRLRNNTEPRLRVNDPVFVVSGPCDSMYAYAYVYDEVWQIQIQLCYLVQLLQGV